MNLALRKEIISEKNRLSQIGNDSNTILFFKKISQILGFPVNSFQQTINIISDLKNCENAHSASKTVKIECSSQLEAAKSKINILKSELERANSVIFKQKSAIDELKQNNDEYKKLIKDEIRDTNSCKVKEIRNDQYIFKLEAKNQKLKNAILNLQNEVRYMKNQSVDLSDDENLHKVPNIDSDQYELLISQTKKLKMKVKYFKQMAKDLHLENEKLNHQLKIKSECHWSRSSIKDAFFNIQDLLGLDPDTSPGETYSAVSSLVCRLHNCM